jgi:hypothetical protein
MSTAPTPTKPVPSKPWALTPKARAREVFLLLGAVLSSFVVVQLTAMKGKLAYFAVFFIAYALLTAGAQYVSRGKASAKDAVVKTLVIAGAVITVLPFKKAFLVFTLDSLLRICRWLHQQIRLQMVAYYMQ